MSVGLIPLRQGRLPELRRRGLPVPAYDRGALRPRIVHVGVGGFHRAHLAWYTDAAAHAGGDWGIAGLGLLEQDETIARTLMRQDHLYTLVTKGPAEPEAAVVGALVGFEHAPGAAGATATRRIARPETAILSLTVTEAGYAEPTAEALAAGERTSFDRIAEGLRLRRDDGGGPLTVMSCDNLPGNGDAAREATLQAAARLDPRLPAWVSEHCTFPNAMVDRITPVTADEDRAWLRDAHGVDDEWPVVAEPFMQWVLEDDFAAGRPAWEGAGALFATDVHAWELYKLRLLNAAHSSMAYLSALAGFVHVDEAMAVPAVRVWLEELLLAEALPTLDPIPGHTREAYVASVLGRFENTGIHDGIARLCIDGSAKFPVFLIPTIEAQLAAGGPVERSATALAAWARYLGTVAPEDQAHDTSAAAARAHAREALSDPVAFLDFAAVFGPRLRESERFRLAFARAYRRIASEGPLTVMADPHGRLDAGAAR